MTTQEDFEKSKARLDDLSERHRKALLYAEALKNQYDEAQGAANKLQEQLDKENARYMELEQKLEAEKKQAAAEETPDAPAGDIGL